MTRAYLNRDDSQTAGGAALMEVVAALTIFFIAAVFVMDGLNSSLQVVHSARLEATAADLAVTVLSEVQMGLLQIRNEGPSPFDEKLFPGWSWELAVSDIDDMADVADLKHVEVVVRNADEPFTYRLAQLVWDDPAQQTGAASGELEDVAQQLQLPGSPAGNPGGSP